MGLFRYDKRIHLYFLSYIVLKVIRRSLVDSSLGDPELSSELMDVPECEETDSLVVDDVLGKVEDQVEELIFDESVETLVIEECAVDYVLEEVVESIIGDTVDAGLKNLPDHCAGCETLRVQLRSAQKNNELALQEKEGVGREN